MQDKVVLARTRVPGLSQGMALIVLGGLPTMAIVSLVPNLPQLFKQFSQVPNHEFWVPMIITMPSLCVALFSPVAGTIADVWGRRKLLIASLILFSIVGVLPMLVDNLFTIIATRFFVGVAEAGILTCGNALMGDYFAGSDRHLWLGRQATQGTILATLFMLSGGALGSLNWHAPFALYAIGLPVALWVIRDMWEPAKRVDATTSNATPKSRFPWSAAVLVSAATVGVAIVYFVQAVQLGRIFGDLGVESPGRISVFTAIASVGVLMGGYFYRKVAVHGVAWVLALAFTAFAVGYIGVSQAPNYWIGLPLAIIAQLANGLVFPALLNWALGNYDFEHRGRGMGLWGSCFFIGMFVSPPLVTAIGKPIGSFLQTVGVIGMACAVVAIITFWRAQRTA